MTQQSSPSKANASTNPSENFQVHELLALASIRGVENLLRKALEMAIRALSAEAGSILFQGPPLQELRLGAFRPEALTRIERWEEVIGKRLANGIWNIPGGAALPISVAKINEGQLTLANIPLLRETTVVGSLSLALSAGSEVTDKQRHLLSQIAKVVGQMASLTADLDSTQRRLNQIGVFYQVSQALVTTFDIHRLLADTMQLAANVLDAGASSIMLIDEKTQELVFEISHGPQAKTLRQQRIPLDEGIAGWVAQHGHPVIANNARTDPRFSHRVDVRTGFLTQSIAAVPLKIKGRIIGVLEVLNKYSGSGFTHEDVELMSSIATQAAIAIENARLYQKVNQECNDIIEADERMRQELADHLHDGSMRLLSAIRTSLDHLERLNEIKPEAVHNEIEALRNLVHKASRDMRNISFEMRPALLESQGLVAALTYYVEHLRRAESFTVHFEAVDDIEYDTQLAGVIFSIAQEAANNVRRHAGARNLWLSLQVDDDRFLVTVRDDGRGFDIGEVATREQQGTALGLLTMREWAKSIDAELKIESKTGSSKRGTTIQLNLALPDS